VIFIQHTQIRTKDDIHNESPLTELIAFKVTLKEKERYEAVARDNDISSSELFRNLARDYIHEYAQSEDLKNYLRVNNKISSILLKGRIISSRKETNLSHLREIFSDFEAFLDDKISNISESDLQNRLSDFRELSKLIILYDPWLFSKLKPQMNRIIKNKLVKALDTKQVNG